MCSMMETILLHKMQLPVKKLKGKYHKSLHRDESLPILIISDPQESL
jgi:hypothetical protein